MRLSEPERRVARGLLLRLAEVGDGAPERRLVPLEEIERIDGAEPVLEALTDARLVTVGVRSGGAVARGAAARVAALPRLAR